MKQMKLMIGMIAIGLVIASCGGGVQGDKAESGEALAEQLVTGDKRLTADLDKSLVEWIGSKPTGTHNGELRLTEGSVELTEGKLVGGSFVMDMGSIKVLDITDPDMNEQLRGHLASGDFFHIDSFPTATFVITGIEEKVAEGVTHRLTGNLTMKGITRSIAFDAHVKLEDGMFVASTPQFIINRAEWNVQYGSKSFFKNLKDNFINDDIGLKINLTATL